MPRHKIQANRVSSYFTLARVESADQTQGEEMALTKEDLLSSLRAFKTELHEELTTDIRATLEAFQTDVNGKLAALQTDVNSVETHLQNLQQKVTPVETELTNGAQCSLFQEIAPATLARRQQFRPVMEALREKKIKYRWTFPFGVAFERYNKACHFSMVEAAAGVLGLETREGCYRL
ncbi:hypothetical protein NDU88_001932 [Pleurodeles waltl]|uniref:Uncharacterized protein n=1 Tax=Pleurodeles waltl TaxID=8319 RepID=A0AAV7T1R1_PLEWA|nr:hypothetical protein NDU88_001932 [Pleurodeles waltl]